MFTPGSFLHSAWRGIMSLAAFGIPFVLLQMPADWKSMSLGTVLMILGHYAEKNITK